MSKEVRNVKSEETSASKIGLKWSSILKRDEENERLGRLLERPEMQSNQRQKVRSKLRCVYSSLFKL